MHNIAYMLEECIYQRMNVCTIGEYMHEWLMNESDLKYIRRIRPDKSLDGRKLDKIYVRKDEIDAWMDDLGWLITWFTPRGVPWDLPEGGGADKFSTPPLLEKCRTTQTNSMRNLSLTFLIWPSPVIQFNTKNKGYQKPGGGGDMSLPPPYGPHIFTYTYRAQSSTT